MLTATCISMHIVAQTNMSYICVQRYSAARNLCRLYIDNKRQSWERAVHVAFNAVICIAVLGSFNVVTPSLEYEYWQEDNSNDGGY